MEKIRNEVIELLSHYDIEWESVGLDANLDAWARNKATLLDALRAHPNWSEDALAVILATESARAIDRDTVGRCWLALQNFARENLRRASYDMFSLYAAEIVKHCVQLVPAEAADAIDGAKSTLGIKKLAVGQKTSKAIGALARAVALNKIAGYDALYADFANAVNPLTVKTKTILSVHPCDYLNMSPDASSWAYNSCHRVHDNTGGEYMAGTLSYMNDSATMILYTIADDAPTPYFMQNKLNRQVFCYEDDTLLQSRLYPDFNVDKMQNFRNIAQSIIADSFGNANLWLLKTEHEKVSQHFATTKYTRHYPDYFYSQYKATVSVLKNSTLPENVVGIGHIAYCLDCASELPAHEGLNCCKRNAEECYACSDYIQPGEERSGNDGNVYCENCVSWCDCCEDYALDVNVRSYTPANSTYHEYACIDCLEDGDFYKCEKCGEWHEGDGYSVDCSGAAYCQECFYEVAIFCNDCDNPEHIEDATYTCNGPVCGNCAEDYTVCPHCDEVVIIDETCSECGVITESEAA